MFSNRKVPIVIAVYGSALVQGLTVVSVPASASALKLALDDAQYGALFVPQMIATIAGSLLAGRLGGRAVSGRTLAVAVLASALAEALLAGAVFAGSFGAALGATSALGFGFGLSASALNAWPGRLFPRRADSALVALHTVLAGGFAVGPALASSVGARGLWFVLPLLIAGLALVCCGLAARYVASDATPLPAASTRETAAEPDGARAEPATQKPWWRTIATKRAAFLLIAVAYALAEGTFANWAVVYLREERELSAAWAALALSMFWSALAFGRLAASALLVRVPAVAIWRALPVAMALAFLALPLVRGAPAALLGFAFAGLSCSAFFPLTVGLAAAHFPGGAARASSLLTAALMVGVGLGSFAIGPLRGAASLADLYRFSAAYPLLALALSLWVSARTRAQTKHLEGAGVA